MDRSHTLFEITPPLHGDLAAVKLAFVFDAGLLGLLASRLPGVAPTEIIEFPVGIRRKHQVPYRQRNQVD